MREITHATACEVRKLDGVRCTCGARSNQPFLNGGRPEDVVLPEGSTSPFCVRTP